MKTKEPCEQAKCCEQCRHFRQHYVREGRSHYVPIHAGHCVHPRLKDRTVDTPACPRFSSRPDQDSCGTRA